MTIRHNKMQMLSTSLNPGRESVKAFTDGCFLASRPSIMERPTGGCWMLQSHQDVQDAHVRIKLIF